MCNTNRLVSFFRLFAVLVTLCLIGVRPLSAQSDYQPPKRTDPNSWSMIFLPDPQSYIKFERNQPLFDLMTAWIADQIDILNIRLVLCTGDLVEQNDLLNPDGINGDQPSRLQWASVAGAFDRLDGRVPYMSALGNHDFGFVSSEDRHTFYDRYFPVEKNFLSRKMLREVPRFAGEPASLANAAYEMTTPHGRKLLILVLEFAPRQAVLDWAFQVVNKEKYARHTVIVLTHSYMKDNKRIEKEGYAIQDANYGEAIWQKLVKPSHNIRLVLAGHVALPEDVMAHLSFKTDLNAAGKKVHQMVFNAQALGGGWHGNGGDGWLRILEFMPDNKTVKVRTFSPLFAISPTTRKFAWRTESYDQFSFELEE